MNANYLLGDEKRLRKEAYDERRSTSIQKYNFQSMEHLDKLTADKIFMSDPARFNDPFDLKLEMADDTLSGPFKDIETLRAAYRVLLDATPDIGDHWFYDDRLLESLRAWAYEGLPEYQVVEAVKQRMRRFGVACFAPHWDMPLMWSHYGKSHTGFCVEYFVRKITFAFDPRFWQLDVAYTSELPSICLSELLFSPHKVLPRILGTKHVDWAYEKEWRLIHLTSRGESVPVSDGLAVASLIIGKNASPSDRERVREKAELGVCVFQIDQRYGKYEFMLAQV